ncbi:MAG: deoxyguanosinetriphosphate triphosphohydrolase [Varibaculum sp.]|nr:deoxyguanosinetriphosphate triphosphohydrolase [Varibaculum sp.]
MDSGSYSDHDRQRYLTEPPKNPHRSDFERDRARIMYSWAMRRAAGKTQVLGPLADDFVRTRLTHSLEVAQVGRSLARQVGADPDLVEAACLAHDLGHPPFGHNGEQALDEMAADIGGFEGNAQTFRLLTYLEPKVQDPDGRPVGLNLTRATLDAVCKYPWPLGAGPDPNSRKHSVYAPDRTVFDWVRSPHTGAAHPGQERCVEAQIMDVSDDIAYSVHDVEDAIQIGWFDPRKLDCARDVDAIIADTREWYGNKFSPSELGAALERLRADGSWLADFDGGYADMAALKNMTSDLIGRFIVAVEYATLAANPIAGVRRYTGTLVVPEETEAEILVCKGIAVHYVMAPRQKDTDFMLQRSTVAELVDVLRERPGQLEEPYLSNFRDASGEPERLRSIVDQVASLTDVSANRMHARLVGMITS